MCRIFYRHFEESRLRDKRIYWRPKVCNSCTSVSSVLNWRLLGCCYPLKLLAETCVQRRCETCSTTPTPCEIKIRHLLGSLETGLEMLFQVCTSSSILVSSLAVNRNWLVQVSDWLRRGVTRPRETSFTKWSVTRWNSTFYSLLLPL